MSILPFKLFSLTLSKIKQSQVTKSLDEKLFEKNKKPKEKIIKINKDSKGKHQEKTFSILNILYYL